MKRLIWVFTLSWMPIIAWASGSWTGQFDFGAEGQYWTTNYGGDSDSYEFLAPLSLSATNKNDGFNAYFQGEYAYGHYADYQDPVSGNVINLSHLSDAALGIQIPVKSFGLPSIVSISMNLPTGDDSWEDKQQQGNIPVEFIDSRYVGEGWGISGLYGVSVPEGNVQTALGAGYLYSGTYNPDFNLANPSGASVDEKLGDAIFVAASRIETFSETNSSVIRLSALGFLPTYEGGQEVFRMGDNFNISYALNNLNSFSFEAGGQFILSAQRMDTNGNVVPEPHDSYGQRFYFYPSYSIGNFSVLGRIKFVTANGYASDPISPFFDDGGFLLGIQPSYRFVFDSSSSFKLSASFDNVIWRDKAESPSGLVNAIYDRWTLGGQYEVKL